MIKVRLIIIFLLSFLLSNTFGGRSVAEFQCSEFKERHSVYKICEDEDRSSIVLITRLGDFYIDFKGVNQPHHLNFSLLTKLQFYTSRPGRSPPLTQ